MRADAFTPAECGARTCDVQAAMAQAGIDALLLTTAPDFAWLAGFRTRFWESPTRPWFLVIPASGTPVAVIPAIGAALMGRTWITDIRTWASPDYADDGVSLLADTLAELAPSGRIGTPSGGETHLRMPLADWAALQARLPRHRFTGDDGILRRLRMVKSGAEIAAIAAACGTADRAFARVPDIAHPGTPLSEVFRRFQMLCLDEGAETVPYLAGAAGPGGYADVISPADERPLAPGDVLMLDTGLMRGGYFCDFDRNFGIGPQPRPVRDAHARLIEATRAGFKAARPGATAANLHAVMARALGDAAPGRLGHGLGLQLTEPPSLMPGDNTVLVPGMVLTLEPGIEVSPGRILVHEENIVIGDTGADWLSTPATDLPGIDP